MIREFNGKKPVIHPTAIVDESSLIMGNVVVEERASIWPHAMIRADEAMVRVEKEACLLDKVFVEAPRETVIGKRSIISHGAIIHGSIIGDDVLVGIGAIVLEVEVGRGSIVAAGAVVREDVGEGVMVAGVPAREVKKVGEKERQNIEKMRREIAEKATHLYRK